MYICIIQYVQIKSNQQLEKININIKKVFYNLKRPFNCKNTSFKNVVPSHICIDLYWYLHDYWLPYGHIALVLSVIIDTEFKVICLYIYITVHSKNILNCKIMFKLYINIEC